MHRFPLLRLIAHERVPIFALPLQLERRSPTRLVGIIAALNFYFSFAGITSRRYSSLNRALLKAHSSGATQSLALTGLLSI